MNFIWTAVITACPAASSRARESRFPASCHSPGCSTKRAVCPVRSEGPTVSPTFTNVCWELGKNPSRGQIPHFKEPGRKTSRDCLGNAMQALCAGERAYVLVDRDLMEVSVRGGDRTAGKHQPVARAPELSPQHPIWFPRALRRAVPEHGHVWPKCHSESILLHV